MRKILLVLALFLVAATAAPATAWEILYVEVPAADKYERTEIAQSGMGIQEVYADRIRGYATPEEVDRLIVAGFDVEILPLPEHAGWTILGYPSRDSDYHDHAELTAYLQQVAADYPDFVSLFSIGTSIEGRELWTLKISDNPGTDESATEAGVSFVGQHHAREHISKEVPLGLIDYLVTTYDYLYSTTQLLDTNEVWITPSLNPDGSEYDIVGGNYHWWRKNRRDNPGTTCDGVDPNRNYGYMWGGSGSSGYECDETYRGPSAFSEPETQAYRDLIIAHDNISILVSYHNYGKLILYPWGYTYSAPPEPDRSIMSGLANSYAAFNDYAPVQSSDLYITSGDTGDWAYGAEGVYTLTVELDPEQYWGDFYVPDEDIPEIQDKNVPAMLYLISNAAEPGKAAVPPTPEEIESLRADFAEYRAIKAELAAASLQAPTGAAFELETGCGALPMDMEGPGPESFLILVLVCLPVLILLLRRRKKR